MNKFLIKHKRRKILRRRRSCIRRYSRTVKKLNNFRKREIRELKLNNRKRVGAIKRLKKFCKKNPNKKCFQNRYSKFITKYKNREIRFNLRREKRIKKLQARITFLSKTCDNLHTMAKPLIKKKITY